MTHCVFGIIGCNSTDSDYRIQDCECWLVIHDIINTKCHKLNGTRGTAS